MVFLHVEHLFQNSESMEELIGPNLFEIEPSFTTVGYNPSELNIISCPGPR